MGVTKRENGHFFGKQMTSPFEIDGKLYVPIEYIHWLEAERSKINSTNLSDIVFTEEGVEAAIPQKRVERFKLVGLNNIDFILTGYYEGVHDGSCVDILK